MKTVITAASRHKFWYRSRSPRIQNTKQCTRVKCHLSYDGEVIYTVLCTFTVDCYTEARYWAFDTKICTLRIYSVEYDTNQLSLFHFQRRLSYPSYSLLPYKITSFQMATVNSTMSPEFRMDIVIERLVGSHLVVFLVLIVSKCSHTHHPFESPSLCFNSKYVSPFYGSVLFPELVQSLV